MANPMLEKLQKVFSKKEPREIPKPSTKTRVIADGVTLLAALLGYYFLVPALTPMNIQLYSYVLVLSMLNIILKLFISGFFDSKTTARELALYSRKNCKLSSFLFLAALAVIIVLTIISAVFFRSRSYAALMTVESGDFASDVEEISYSEIPMLDADSASELGTRTLGTLSDLVSQFEVDSNYTQINLNGTPYRVASLAYGDFFKWWNNRSTGLPGYVTVNMVTQEAEVVRTSEGLKYSPSEFLGHDLMRYLRFHYPTYLFDTPHLEVDDIGNPIWICPRLTMRIGLISGRDVIGAVLLNAITGECTYYTIAEVPTWVDQIYSSALILEQYSYYGRYSSGFLNSIFGQTGVTATSEGANYIALNDDVYLYTGITSAGNDQSNIGFLLCNQRTKETKFYMISGATETSAQSSAEGVVQHLAYRATFPLLLNVGSQPTYFMALKDSSNLVKMYAMVNVSQYQVVTTGTTVAECEEAYINTLIEDRIISPEDTAFDTQDPSGPAETAPEQVPTAQGTSVATGIIADIRSNVKNGTTCYYIRLEGDEQYYMTDSEHSELAVVLNTGDPVRIEWSEAADSIFAQIVALELTP